MEFHGISRIPGSKALTKRDNRLRLVLQLKVGEGTRYSAYGCLYSSLRVRGILDIS